MSSNIDFKTLWSRKQVAMPDSRELYQQSKKFKMKNLRKIIVTNILLLATCVYIASIWYYQQPQLISTKIGIVLAILAMVFFLAVYNQMISLFTKLDESLSNSEYLQQLLKIKKKQLFVQSTLLNLYFILLSGGIFLYMIEPAMAMNLFWAIFSFAATLAWVVFAWLVIRPRQAKKQNEGINELIEKFKALNHQLSE